MHNEKNDDLQSVTSCSTSDTFIVECNFVGLELRCFGRIGFPISSSEVNSPTISMCELVQILHVFSGELSLLDANNVCMRAKYS